MTEIEHSTWTGEQLVEYLELALTTGGARNILPDEKAVLNEIASRLAEAGDEAFVIPVAACDRIRELFGGGRRTFEAMERRVRFAYRVWQGKYGPWSPEQADYAESLILWALDEPTLSRCDPGHRRALAYTRLDRIVNHENTHKGFTSREAAGVDITLDLMEALS